MGPELVKATKAGAFDVPGWTAASEAANARDFDQTLAAIAAQSDAYPALVNAISDEEMREQIDMFGQKPTRGSFLVNLALCGCAAYRTQLFNYLKANGRDELTTMNLWGGIDAPPPAS
jgi:hypothetical protein